MRILSRSLMLKHSSQERKRLHRQIRCVEQLEQRTVFSTYWVTNLEDSGNGSLRAAIEAANTNPGLDTIQFRNNLRGTIALTSQLSISDSLEIQANPANKVIVSGQGVTRVFNIAAGTDVTMRNLTVAKGYTQEAEGGAGVLNAGNLHLIGSVVTGNTTEGTELWAGRGGGIRSSGNLTLDRSKVTGNTASTDGGGILQSSGSMTLRHSVVSGNRAVGDGAGIRSERGTVLTIERSEISDNVATGFGTGGIAAGGKMTITDSKIIRNNSAAAGIYLMLSSTGDVVIARSEISHNSIGDRFFGAAGIWSFSQQPLRIEDSAVENNQGVSIYAPFGSSVHILGSKVSNNTGGFVTVQVSGQSSIENSTISDNVSRGTGGVSSFGDLTIDSSTIRNNQGGGSGGLSSSGSLTLISSTIRDNRGGLAGGINSFGSLTLISSTVSGNVGILTGSYGGGGIVGRAALVNSTISGNIVDASNMNLDSPYSYSEPTVAGGWLVTREGNSVVSSTITGNRVINAPDKSIVSSAGGVNTMDIEFSFYGYYGDLYEYSYPADISPRNTIIARNEVNGLQDDVAGKFVSGGHNLIGVLNNSATGFVASDLRGNAAKPLDPKLGPLAFNGGKTKNHRPLGNSPAINAGDNSDATETDQRGFQRITGGRIDIGSVEANSWPVLVDLAFQRTNKTGGAISEVRMSGQAGASFAKSSGNALETRLPSADRYEMVDRALKSLTPLNKRAISSDRITGPELADWVVKALLE